jgi:hypothetical protein
MGSPTPTGTYDGIIKMRGPSPTAAYPAPPFTLPVRVQVRASNGSCWGAVYSTPLRNDTQHFRAPQD